MQLTVQEAKLLKEFAIANNIDLNKIYPIPTLLDLETEMEDAEEGDRLKNNTPK